MALGVCTDRTLRWCDFVARAPVCADTGEGLRRSPTPSAHTRRARRACVALRAVTSSGSVTTCHSVLGPGQGLRHPQTGQTA